MFLTFANKARFHSLTLKLVILYTLSTLGILIALGLFFYSKTIGFGAHFSPAQMTYLRSECYDMMMITFLVGAIAAMLLGYIVTRRGLARIGEFADTVNQITAQSLHQRIDATEWPNELKYLGVTSNQMLDRLQTSFTQLSQFSADIAHELRTPVHNLMMITELALLKNRTKADYHQVMVSQVQELQHLAKLIDSLLFLARSDQGELSLEYELIDVREEIEHLFDFYHILATEKQIQLQCTGQLTLLADRSLFKRMMTNLFSNALRYTPTQGQVSIDLATVKQGSCITVRDTGIGIPAEHLQKVFDRCYRVNSDRNAESGGLGLGLAIVKSILDLHRGTFKISSQEQAGTTIQVYFPANNA